MMLIKNYLWPGFQKNLPGYENSPPAIKKGNHDDIALLLRFSQRNSIFRLLYHRYQDPHPVGLCVNIYRSLYHHVC